MPAERSGMQPAEPESRRPAADHGLQDLVAPVAASESVTVSEDGGPSAEGRADRSIDQLDSDFVGQKRASPEVVIPGDEANPNAGIDEVPENVENGEVTTLYHRAVLEPEVEQVSIDHEVPGPVCRQCEKPPERVLVLERRGAEVGVGNDKRAVRLHRRQYRAGPDGMRHVYRGAT